MKLGRNLFFLFLMMKYCHQGLLLSVSGCHTSLCCLYLKFCHAFYNFLRKKNHWWGSALYSLLWIIIIVIDPSIETVSWCLYVVTINKMFHMMYSICYLYLLDTNFNCIMVRMVDIDHFIFKDIKSGRFQVNMIQ